MPCSVQEKCSQRRILRAQARILKQDLDILADPDKAFCLQMADWLPKTLIACHPACLLGFLVLLCWAYRQPGPSTCVRNMGPLHSPPCSTSIDSVSKGRTDNDDRESRQLLVSLLFSTGNLEERIREEKNELRGANRGDTMFGACHAVPSSRVGRGGCLCRVGRRKLVAIRCHGFGAVAWGQDAVDTQRYRCR